MGECCQACLFSKRMTNAPRLICRRYPPSIRVEGRSHDSYFFPTVNVDEWCGEFKLRPGGTCAKQDDESAEIGPAPAEAPARAAAAEAQPLPEKEKAAQSADKTQTEPASQPQPTEKPAAPEASGPGTSAQPDLADPAVLTVKAKKAAEAAQAAKAAMDAAAEKAKRVAAASKSGDADLEDEAALAADALKAAKTNYEALAQKARHMAEAAKLAKEQQDMFKALGTEEPGASAGDSESAIDSGETDAAAPKDEGG